jgi:thiol-disulfide isomerase/thioredoxin
MVNFVKDKTEFTGLITDNKMVVVDFTASWCGPCRRIAPTYEKMVELFDVTTLLCYLGSVLIHRTKRRPTTAMSCSSRWTSTSARTSRRTKVARAGLASSHRLLLVAGIEAMPTFRFFLNGVAQGELEVKGADEGKLVSGLSSLKELAAAAE